MRLGSGKQKRVSRLLKSTATRTRAYYILILPCLQREAIHVPGSTTYRDDLVCAQFTMYVLVENTIHYPVYTYRSSYTTAQRLSTDRHKKSALLVLKWLVAPRPPVLDEIARAKSSMQKLLSLVSDSSSTNHDRNSAPICGLLSVGLVEAVRKRPTDAEVHGAVHARAPFEQKRAFDQ